MIPELRNFPGWEIVSFDVGAVMYVVVGLNGTAGCLSSMNETVCGSIDFETQCTVSPALIQIFSGPYAIVWTAPEPDSAPTLTFQVLALVVVGDAAWTLLAISAGTVASNRANTARNTEDLLGRADIGGMLNSFAGG
jgi:hypothetical protein